MHKYSIPVQFKTLEEIAAYPEQSMDPPDRDGDMVTFYWE
jgi:hypothetical protein